MEDLSTRERNLLGSLTELEAEAIKLRTQLDTQVQEIAAVKQDLDGVRNELLDAFLHEKLSPLLIVYVIKTSPTGEVLLDLSPAAGGELEYDKMKTGIQWVDMDNVPLFYLLAYLGEGSPWSTPEGQSYVQS